MRILINASNLGPGGGSQVADSICRSLSDQKDDEFVVVLPERLQSTADAICDYENVEVVIYSFHNTFKSRLFHRDDFLDGLVESKNIDVVFSVFAPTWWSPRCAHLCGFALAHLVMPESPFFKRISAKEWIKQKINCRILLHYYRASSRYYYSENELITKRIKPLLRCRKAYTVTNYYNQVFDLPDLQKEHKLPEFDGITLLSISSFYPHKNLEISLDIARLLFERYPEMKLRFVFTIEESQFPVVPAHLRKYFLFIGRVDISECPSLYRQCTFAFQPTLLECFTATYPEAMRSGKPIVTPNLEFARGLCGDAAVYYDALSGEDACKKIVDLSQDKVLQRRLIEEGRKTLKKFDSYFERTNKIISLCKEVYADYNRK